MKGSYFGFGSPNNRLTSGKVKKHFHCLIMCIYFYLTCSTTLKRFTRWLIFQTLLCVTLICSDWSDWSHFYFISPVMPDKAAFVSAVLLCVQLYRGNRYFTQKQYLVSKNEFVFSFRPTWKDQQVSRHHHWHQHETAWDSSLKTTRFNDSESTLSFERQ